MKEEYQRQVNLLLDILPIVAQTEVFALKGGTAINFFVLDCPRLSVDIDLHYIPLNSRKEALQDIRDNMEAIKSGIEKSFPNTKVSITPKTCNALVRNDKALIKIEPNHVIRGTLLPPVGMSLCPSLEQEFNRSMNIDCMAKPELYAGKLCAALQRQHPRDLFDTLLFLEEGEGLTREVIDAFLIYLISQGKPIHEMLAPNIHDRGYLNNNQFLGMTKKDVSLERLREIQRSLPAKILSAMTERDKAFLIGFKEGEPNWNLLSFPNAKELPAVRWKQLNLNKINKGKRAEETQKLVEVLNNIPDQEVDRRGVTMSSPNKKLEPQMQLAQEIIDELIGGKLINQAKGEQLQQQIAAGSLKAEDWSLLVDITTEQNNHQIKK